jgi:RNA polymerase sigma-70 factor, ECF subfamily
MRRSRVSVPRASVPCLDRDMEPDPPLLELLDDSRAGDPSATARLFTLVYGELRSLAARAMRGERRCHTLQPTALVHEAWLRLMRDTAPEIQSRAHFFALAAGAMRRVLIDHARRRSADKRAAGEPIPEASMDAGGGAEDDYLAGLGEALEELELREPKLVRLVELRFFAGFTVEETAEILGVSARTVKRDWSFARGWLYRRIRERHPSGEFEASP